MIAKSEQDTGSNDSKSFFNAYIPVVALLLAFFMAVPQRYIRYLSPDAVNQITEQTVLNATIPLRSNGSFRKTQRLGALIDLAKLHKLSATISVASPRRYSTAKLITLMQPFAEPAVRVFLARATPKVRIRIMTVERLYD